MWDGLIAPSDSAWAKGANVLADAPLTQRALSGEKSIPPSSGSTWLLLPLRPVLEGQQLAHG
jgi:hypothetical protein